MKIQYIGIVLKKELRDILRDRRALFVSIVMPLILFPLIFSAMDTNIKVANEKFEKNIAVAVKGRGFLRDFLHKREEIHVIESEKPLQDLKDGRVYAVISISEISFPTVTITIDNSRQSSIIAAEHVAALINDFSTSHYKKRGRQGVSIKIERSYIENKEYGAGKLTLSLLLPMLLVIFSAISPVAVAADLGAGEKERFTLEPLLSTPPTRIALLLGKVIAILVIGIIGVLSFISGLAISFFLTPGFFGKSEMAFHLSPQSIGLIIFITLLLILIFGTAELALSLYARSLKEAQIFFIPLLIIAMSCAYGSTMIDPKNIDPIFRHIPLVNIALLLKELSMDIISSVYIVTTIAWALFYLACGFLLSLWMFLDEKVLFRS